MVCVSLISQKTTLKMKMAEIFCTVTKASHISNFNPVICKLVSVYKILLPEPNYQLKRTEKSTTGFSSQKFYSDKQYIGFSCVCEHSHVTFADTTAVFMAMA